MLPAEDDEDGVTPNGPGTDMSFLFSIFLSLIFLAPLWRLSQVALSS